MKKQYVIVKEMKFDAGHRVLNHESKCRSPHGHEYFVKVHARSAELDDLGRVIDFSVIKDRIGGWLDTNWDHTFIVNSQDEKMIAALLMVDSYKPFFIFDGNPTAENMATYLLHTVCPQVMAGTGVEVFKIQLWETHTSCAEAELG